MYQLQDGSVSTQAKQVLRYCQHRDYEELSKHLALANDDVINDLTFGRLALSIPPQHYELIKMAFPMIACPDANERTLGWKGFMSDDLSLPYKINMKLRNI